MVRPFAVKSYVEQLDYPYINYFLFIHVFIYLFLEKSLISNNPNMIPQAFEECENNILHF